MELVIAVNTKKWKDYLDELNSKWPIKSVGDIPAIGRLIFTLNSYIDVYQNSKDLLRYNDDFNHYVFHLGRKDLQIEEFNWGFKEDTDYTLELIKLKEMIVAYATLKK